jgi:hypothetical protein
MTCRPARRAATRLPAARGTAELGRDRAPTCTVRPRAGCANDRTASRRDRGTRTTPRHRRATSPASARPSCACRACCRLEQQTAALAELRHLRRHRRARASSTSSCRGGCTRTCALREQAAAAQIRAAPDTRRGRPTLAASVDRGGVAVFVPSSSRRPRTTTTATTALVDRHRCDAQFGVLRHGREHLVHRLGAEEVVDPGQHHSGGSPALAEQLAAAASVRLRVGDGHRISVAARASRGRRSRRRTSDRDRAVGGEERRVDARQVARPQQAMLPDQQRAGEARRRGLVEPGRAAPSAPNAAKPTSASACRPRLTHIARARPPTAPAASAGRAARSNASSWHAYSTSKPATQVATPAPSTAGATVRGPNAPSAASHAATGDRPRATPSHRWQRAREALHVAVAEQPQRASARPASRTPARAPAGSKNNASAAPVSQRRAPGETRRAGSRAPRCAGSRRR